MQAFYISFLAFFLIIIFLYLNSSTTAYLLELLRRRKKNPTALFFVFLPDVIQMLIVEKRAQLYIAVLYFCGTMCVRVFLFCAIL